jgi:hypothetical protein
MKPQLILLASVPAVEDLGGEDGKRMVLCGGELVVLASDYETLQAENARLRAALQKIADSGAEHPWGGPAAFARKTLSD